MSDIGVKIVSDGTRKRTYVIANGVKLSGVFGINIDMQSDPLRHVAKILVHVNELDIILDGEDVSISQMIKSCSKNAGRAK